MHALMIENDRTKTRALGAWLEETGFSARTATTTEQARMQLRRIRPTLVTLSPDILDTVGGRIVENLRRAGRTIVLRVRDPLSASSSRCARNAVYDADTVLVSGHPRRVIGAMGMIGESPAMAATYASILSVSRTESPVFVFGETGTGKELVARAVHALGPRSGGPFVAVNCGAIPGELFESELFGHERGSFTGAWRTRRGLCEQAHGGTLFLDEIAEMPVHLQGKLLRVLERGELMRIGGERRIRFDARIVSATNRAPAQVVKKGALREDLYHRLFVYPIELRPLRERGGDVELLCEFLLARRNQGAGMSRQLSARSRRQLGEHRWRGNVRELYNAVERAVILAGDSNELDVSPMNGLELSLAAPAKLRQIKVGMTIAELQRILLESTLDFVGGNKVEAARLLGVSLKTIYNRLAVYGEEMRTEVHDVERRSVPERLRTSSSNGTAGSRRPFARSREERDRVRTSTSAVV